MPKSKFNMAAAIRDVLGTSPKLTQGECMAAVQAAHPKETINGNSFGVAFSNQRKRLGIAPGGKRRARTTKVHVPPQATPVPTVGVDPLLAARDFIASAGGLEQAQETIERLKRLQF